MVYSYIGNHSVPNNGTPGDILVRVYTIGCDVHNHHGGLAWR